MAMGNGFSVMMSYITGASKIELTATIVAIVEPATDIPQIIQLYSTKSSEDFNLLTWYLGLGFGIIWLVYSVKEKSVPVFMSALLWLITDIILLYGIVKYQ